MCKKQTQQKDSSGSYSEEETTTILFLPEKESQYDNLL